MTAFAAIFSRDGRPIGGEDADGVARTLAAMTGVEPHSGDAGPCRFFLAPLHEWSPRMIVRSAAGMTAAGQVMLEGAVDLRREIGLPAAAPELEVAAAALARWGVDGASRLRGEYALAVWHEREEMLICARDGLGIRVLYVGESAGVVVVSNTIDAVMAHPAIAQTVDDGALVRFLANGSVTTSTATPYRAVKLLPDGHTLVLRPGRLPALRRHWQPPPMDRGLFPDDRSAPEGYREVLQRAVSDRLSGRRATIFLSGGLDSPTIAATAVGCARELRAVTFRYRSVDAEDDVRLAAEAARYLGIRGDLVYADAHIALEAERRGELSAVLADEPGLANWREGLRHAARFSTLAVYGEDGDALLAPPGGAALLAAQPLPSAAMAAMKLIATGQERPYLGLRLRERIGWSRPPRPAPTPWLTRAARRLVDDEDGSVLGAEPQPPEFGTDRGRAWARLLRNVPRDFAVSLSPDVTRQRLELTLPLMDTRVIRYALSIPPIPWCHRKRVAREAFAGRLPASILERPKTPIAGAHEALVAGWRRQYVRVARDPQTAAMVAQCGWLDLDVWRNAIEQGSAQVAMAAWRVLMLDAWLTRAAAVSPACTR